jgi:fucose 4-O-acetylase-like acetyltransferase
VVHDEKQSTLLYVFQAFVHGFRMPLFMLLSGFFTALFWRRHGLKSLFANRLRRVVLPFLLGVVTVLPAIHISEKFALRIQPVADNPLWRTRAGSPEGPVLPVIWFLWFLIWFLPFFGIYARAAQRFGWQPRPNALFVSQWNLVWLVPLTLVPASRMGGDGSDFGPEASLGIFPTPHVLAYYALFFGFGVLHHETGPAGERLGRAWIWTLPLTLLVVFPLALDLTSGAFGIRERMFPNACFGSLAAVFQVLYAWLMCFAWIGMFRASAKRESRALRYLADAAYWCYLAHLPVVILAQALVSRWALPALLKFSAVFSLVALAMYVSYEKLVRNRWIGTFLNGRRGG